MGTGPDKVLASAGLDGAALSDLENRIPHVAMARLLRECAMRTGCRHFGLLAGQARHRPQGDRCIGRSKPINRRQREGLEQFVFIKRYEEMRQKSAELLGFLSSLCELKSGSQNYLDQVNPSTRKCPDTEYTGEHRVSLGQGFALRRPVVTGNFTTWSLCWRKF
jgi:Arabinose-binding domain of AraC transcription regulator, N-term